MVECADGINMFFGHYFNWDSPNRLSIAYDQILCHSLIRDRLPLSQADRIWLDKLIKSRRRDFVFLSLRYLKKFGRLPPELYRIAKITRWFPIWYSYTVAWIIICKPLGLYRPF